jgi:hypothetical protein
MRRTLTACRSGLSVAAALVLLTACGGSDGGNAQSSGASKSSASASGTSAAAADSKFCTEAASIEERVGSTLNGQSDPSALPKALQEAAAEIRAIKPPDEIASDWNALADGFEQIATAFGSINPNDPNARATFQQQVGQLEAQLGNASTKVETYLRDQCGLETGSTESASPTS